MSWEEMYRRDYPCKCGKGTVTYVCEMDDWNRRRDYELINCLECAEEAIATSLAKEKAKKEAQYRLKKLTVEIKKDFEEKYMEQWQAFFAHVKNKKQAWELAKEIGVESYSLSSFYDYNKGNSIADYALKLAKPYNMKKIMEILKIEDADFKCKVEEALSLGNYDQWILIN